PPTSTLFPYTTLFRSIFANKQNDRLSSTIKSFLKTLLVQSGIRKRENASKPVPTNTITLDSLMSRILRPVDLVQMDVQGLEADRSEEHTSELQSLRHL